MLDSYKNILKTLILEDLSNLFLTSTIFLQVNDYKIVLVFFFISAITWQQLSINLPEFTQFVQLMKRQNNSCYLCANCAINLKKHNQCTYTRAQNVCPGWPVYEVKQPQEKWVCDFHDDAPPLSFQLQVAEVIF